MLKLININFYKDFSEKNRIPYFYENVYNKISLQDYFNKKKAKSSLHKKGVIAINFIPPYFDLKFRKSDKIHGFFKVFTHYGFLADFKGYSSFSEYFKSQVKAKRRKSLKSQLRKLETCFNLSHKVYLGKIDKSHYAFLLEELRILIKRRFIQRGGVHPFLNNWSFYKESAYSMLIDKKACLFVIYDGEKPIAISLNYLHQNIFVGAIDSYDIDYSKFSPGNIMILKKIEWSLLNNYKIFNMGYGDLKYKREWCNTVYKYESHILFKKNSSLSKLVAYLVSRLILLKINFKQKNKPIQDHFLNFLKKNKKILNINHHVSYMDYLDATNLITSKNTVKLDINKDENAFLRKHVYNFQYSNSENSKDIDVFMVVNDIESDSYIIKGKTNCCILNYTKD
ncbi:GNAT family N-acetyltransferase [Flavivirga spongiicola]|uniref:GNAT family N-acetyltransferase n=1 Tax=Flavivirga spongiicola TaxID=421621 RepID=A0ABU7XYD2_9FLAO|nr:GNAT family N-acetyltransferase [Flavivirga sp. MEBiC05379]MDO5980463.1 GNAT family N-acetyltransferase [Flavivirga sp. MEBiC05379]